MAYEAELKVFITDKSFVFQKLTQMGCVWGKVKRQYDKIYCKKEEASIQSENYKLYLRIRHEENRSILTLKQILDQIEVIEYESAVENSCEVIKMIHLLGFEELVTVKKVRREGKLGDFSICLDEVEELGSFIEIEKIVENDQNRDKVKRELFEFLKQIGAGLEQICEKRYHTMIYERTKKL